MTDNRWPATPGLKQAVERLWRGYDEPERCMRRHVNFAVGCDATVDRLMEIARQQGRDEIREEKVLSANIHNDRTIIDVWFRLRDQMFIENKTPTGARPPSIRDAAYAWALAQRRDTATTPETIEAYVNGLELGALEALREAWSKQQ